MTSRTLCFGSPGSLTLRLEQLVWKPECGDERSFPIEDIGYVIIESPRVVITAAVMNKLAEHNVALVICGNDHMPSAQLHAFAGHTLCAENFAAQLSASDAVCGRAWRQICRAKIMNQAQLAKRLGSDVWREIERLAAEVKNGDPANCEAQAARMYFRALAPEGFIRDRDGVWPNAALNYGYAILRAAVARALIGSGLMLIKGVHHHNRYNAFALADDIMEPYRPFLDQYIFGKVKPFDISATALAHQHKARLLQMLTCDVRLGDYSRPLGVALTYTTASLVRFFKKETDELLLPSFA